MKKFVAGGDSGNKLFEVAYLSLLEGTEVEDTTYVSICAKDAIEAAEIVISLFNVDASKIEYINERKSETIIG